jgi:hypothetical protein
MQRFLMLVGVAVVAAAMYVAASPASQQAKAKAPTAKQFNALKKQVATLSKSLKTVRAEADASVSIIGTCYLTTSGSTAEIVTLPVSQFGTTTSGFVFGTPNSTTGQTARSALDINSSSPLYDLQQVNPACLTGALKHATTQSASSRVRLWAERLR